MMYVPSEVMNVCIQSGPKIHWTRQNPMQHGYTKLRSLSALYTVHLCLTYLPTMKEYRCFTFLSGIAYSIDANG
jgi:hypothetical protein